MFPMTITLQNAAQLNAVLAALNLGTAAVAAPVTAPTVQAALKPEKAVAEGKSAKADPAPGPATATPAAAPEKTAAASSPAAESAAAEPQASTAATDATITYDQVAKAITERAKSDRGHVVATLDKFGAKKGTELKPEDFAAFLKALG